MKKPMDGAEDELTDHLVEGGAPSDGSVWTGGDCTQRVLRGGSWGLSPRRAKLWGGVPTAYSLATGDPGLNARLIAA
jgi:hypothetical protein